jgi:zinc transport system ATP-binding protein
MIAIMNRYKDDPGKADHTRNIIEVEDVSFSYDREKVLEHVSFAVHPGDYIGLIGPNGGGKTTLLKLILGLLPLQSGSVRLFGQEVRKFRDWKRVGYAAQQAAGFDRNFPASVREVVEMGRRPARFWQGGGERDRALVRQALECVDMWAHRDRLIGELSGGQQQRVFIARALVNEPEVIFLDEPTTGVDERAQDGFYDLLQRLNKELGITLVLVSHDIVRLTGEVMHIACVDRTLTCHMSPQQYLEESETAELGGRRSG